MSEELVITEKRGHIQILTLNRPEDMNAFNTALATALGAVSYTHLTLPTTPYG